MTLSLFDLLELLQTSEMELKRFALRGKNYYREFESEKKSGGRRTIVAPAPELKDLQRKIAKVLLKKEALHSACTGFRQGCSIVSNAQPHVGQDFVLNMDLKDFFPSISFKRVIGLFQSLGWDYETSVLLARLTSYKGFLPQGAPTSPSLANLICRKLDRRLHNYCQVRGWQYTRYCDDITISGGRFAKSAMESIAAVIESEGFAINEAKTRIRFKHQQQSVTGIVVNESVRIPRERRHQLRAMCHQMRCDPESFRGVSDRTMGQLSFAQMVEGIMNKGNFQEAMRILLEIRRQAKLAGALY